MRKYLAIAMALAAFAFGAAAEEKIFSTLAVRAAGTFDKAALYTYAPKNGPAERTAVSVALTGHLLLEAHAAGGGRPLLDHARIAGDTLAANTDMNGDGKTGWGRHWGTRGPASDGKGGNTAFAAGCALERNRAYDDELHDTARVAHFLIALSQATGDARYRDTARQAMDDTWNMGEASPGGKGFVYFKTAGACDRGWQVKNVSMLMGVPLALLGKDADGGKYRERAMQVLEAGLAEIEGTPVNLGYFSRDTALRRAGAPGKYVERGQREADGTIACRSDTGAGESCTLHLGLEARALADTAAALGIPRARWTKAVTTLMGGLELRDEALCSESAIDERPRRLTGCAAAYCALRSLSARFAERCRARALASRARTQDIALGLFWGLRAGQR